MLKKYLMTKNVKYKHFQQVVFSTPQYIAVQNLKSVRPHQDQKYSNNIVTCLIQFKKIVLY